MTKSETEGNVFVFSFCREGFEAIVNLSAIDQAYVLAKMADEILPQSVNSILNMMSTRARFNEHRGMEVWVVKLGPEFTEDALLKMADTDPQSAADLARLGENIYGDSSKKPTAKIV